MSNALTNAVAFKTQTSHRQFQCPQRCSMPTLSHCAPPLPHCTAPPLGHTLPTVVSPVHVTLCIQSANSAETFTPHTALAGGITNASEKLQARKNFINFHLYDNGKFNFPCIASDTFGVHSTSLIRTVSLLPLSLSWPVFGLLAGKKG